MLKIEARRWVAVWYRCPRCGAQSGELMLTPWRWAHRRPRECYGYQCNRAELTIVEHKWYTTFCIEPGLSFTTVAGTLATIGPFRLCDIVQPNIRAFRKWYRRHKAEWAARYAYQSVPSPELPVGAGAVTSDQDITYDPFFDED
jgi:hypothetical protein